ncbi:hypothetical protein AALP_AA7G033300 [Arabis alpina]|uniref:Small RNA 2'-O-methyltransferase n=1 Tax=Arabis alpina TaxID=50452 RepID=A0A087GFN4_ARAAL|nr:hypothetical protein AALP_AA7G033300 [Arabis alpina]
MNSKNSFNIHLQTLFNTSVFIRVDFGCGSGSLLDSLLDCSTSLQNIIGVDISQKGLSRAAKMLHSKLNKGTCNLKSIILYDGSILEFDSRLHDIDIGTCVESKPINFGETVLSLFRPKILIVSTPNYEYNTIIQGFAPDHQEDKSKSHKPKFRNHDHKFEWTREQFNKWASKLAKLHNYSVEFSGVGGGYVQYGKPNAQCSLIKSFVNGERKGRQID